MTTDQISLLSKGLKFIPTPTVKENTVRQQLLLDFKQFAGDVCVSDILGTKIRDTTASRTRWLINGLGLERRRLRGKSKVKISAWMKDDAAAKRSLSV